MSSSGSVRLFLGFAVPPGLMQAIITYTESFTPEIEGFRWTRPENIHLTVLFMGETPEKDIPAIVQLIRTRLLDHSPIHLQFKNIDYAPPGSKKTMIWANYENIERFSLLVSDLSRSVTRKSTHGRPLPHITLARFKGKEREVLPEIIMPDMDCNQLILWRSHLTPKGPEYTVIDSFSFIDNG